MLTMIAAMAKNRVIGNQGTIPWHLPSDFKHFKETTMGHSVIMGRKTFESMGSKPLKGRMNFVISHTPPKGSILDVDVKTSTVLRHCRIEDLRPIWNSPKDKFIIGGESLYRHFLRHADRLLISQIDVEVEGDTYFPYIDPNDWRVTTRSNVTTDILPYEIVEYQRHP